MPSGTLWAAWSCWLQKITWLFTWTERLLAGRCPASAGWRDATRWSTGSKTENITTVWAAIRIYSSQECETDVINDKDENTGTWETYAKDITNICLLQTKEEFKVSHYRSPNMVHPDCSGHLKTFYQVRMFLILLCLLTYLRNRKKI